MRSKLTRMEEALAGHGGSLIGYEGNFIGPDRKLTEDGEKKPACCEDLET
jgi:hypothetical protein